MRTVVAVLRGGPSSEYAVSLKTGAAVLEHLDKEKYEPRDIFISRAGEWHLHGVPVAPERALFGSDVAFNALHGAYGEDGQVQRLLEQLGVPYSGSGTLASATAFNKQRAREAAAKLGVKIAHGMVVENTSDVEALTHQLFRTLPQPAIVKPLASGSSIGVNKANNFLELQYALERAFAHGDEALVEECIPGRQATVGIIEQFRGQQTYALIPVPNTFSVQEKARLTAAATAVHEGLGLDHYSSSDFVVGRRGIYFLEVDSLPALAKDSILQRGLEAVGATLSDFIDHVLQLARR